jgi:hypothetical protein
VPLSCPQVAISHDKNYAGRAEVSRIASSNGSWDHLAVNKMARVPMGTGTAPLPPAPRRPSSISFRSSSSIRTGSLQSVGRTGSHAVRDSAHNPEHKKSLKDVTEV